MPFQRGNRLSVGKGRPLGSGFSAQLREVVGKEQFRLLVQTLLDQALVGDVAAASVLVNRLVPALKPVAEPVRLELPEGALGAQAISVVKAIADGTITPGDGKLVVDVLTAAAALGQVSELEDRIRALEDAHGRP